jgi:hypothetical protein
MPAWSSRAGISLSAQSGVCCEAMNVTRFALVVLAAVAVASCSEKREAKESEAENEQQPREDEIAEDCVAFVHATKVVPARGASADCPSCPPPGANALTFRAITVDRVSCAAETCNVTATIRAVFTPGSGEQMAGGLTAWIPPEQRAEYLRGNAPTEEQVYRVKITYKSTGESWRAVEFDKAEAQ